MTTNQFAIPFNLNKTVFIQYWLNVSDWSEFIEIFTIQWFYWNNFYIFLRRVSLYSSTPVCSASVFSNITDWNDSWSDSLFEIFEFWLVDESLDHLLLVWSVSVDEDVLFDDKREILLDKLLLFEWKLNKRFEKMDGLRSKWTVYVL